MNIECKEKRRFDSRIDFRNTRFLESDGGRGVSVGDVVAVGGTGVFVACSWAAAPVGVASTAGRLFAHPPKNNPAAAVAPVWINWRRLIDFLVRCSIVIV